MDTKILTGVLLLVGLAVGIYFTYFHKGSAQDLIKQNQIKKRDKFQVYDYYDDGEDSPARQSVRSWEKWIELMHYVSIGELYDKCDGEDRILIGKVVMLPDKKRGGVRSHTFTNLTLVKELTGGEVFVECQYNGRELYKNHWDLCTFEHNMDNRIIFCPIAPGKKTFIKELHIPNYLPKGRYTIKAWMTNQEDELLGCAFAEFTL